MSILKVSIEQVKAGRALLGWSQTDLAVQSGVSHPSIKRIEAKGGILEGRPATVAAVISALSDAGVEFISPGDLSQSGGAGVRIKKKPPGQ